MRICKKCGEVAKPNNYVAGYYCYNCGNLKFEDAYKTKEIFNEWKNRIRWISVKERLPNERECGKYNGLHINRSKFICTVKAFNLEPIVQNVYYDKILGWIYEEKNYNDFVQAWMPLPEVYKGED